MLAYKCPTTGRSVTTSIEATEGNLVLMRTLSVSVWCPHCRWPHMVPMADTWIERASDDSNQPAVA